MDVRPHMSQHDRAEELPLITEEATVTDVRRLDRNRVDELEETILARLRRSGRGEWADRVAERGGEGVAWERLASLVAGADHVDPDLRECVGDLEARYERPYPSLVSIRLAADEPIEFVAGQYVTLRYDGVPRPYSVANSPNDDGIELCIRRVPGGRLSSRLCARVSPGDQVVLRGPNGEFVLQEPSGRDVAFLATGTGVAPLRSMIEYTFEEGRDRHAGRRRDVWLFLGAAYEDDLPYRERFRELDDEHGNFRFVPTLTREHHLTDWAGESDYVQRVMLKYLADVPEGADLDPGLRPYLDREPALETEARMDPENLEVYACGINAMVNALVGALSDLGLSASRVRSEGYG